MKHRLQTTLIITAIVVILAQTGILTAIVLFWITGLIPGTNYSLPPSITFASTSIIAVAIVIKRHAIISYFVTLSTRRSSQVKAQLPERRYTPITSA